MSKEIKVGVIPAGAMGSFFAKHAVELGYDVTLYFHKPDSLEYFQRNHQSPRLDGIGLPMGIKGTVNISEAVKGKDVVFLAPPSVSFREVFQQVKSVLNGGGPMIISATKGIEQGTNLTMSQIILNEAPELVDQIVVMSGPNLARQMAEHRETGTVFASYNPEAAKRLQALFGSEYFRIYTEEDVIGVEAGGALKNIMAFGEGIARALRVASDTEALYITRALAEMTRLGMALGAQDERTFMGLSGNGDLMLSIIGHGTRNTQAGMAFAKGQSVQDLLSSGVLAESLFTVKAVHDFALEHEVHAPITQAIYGVLYGGLSLEEGIHQLMDRHPTKEHHGARGINFVLGRLTLRAGHRALGLVSAAAALVSSSPRSRGV